MDEAVDAKRFSDVCAGTPWFDKNLCAWVAARAADQPAARPDGDAFKTFFFREHIKKIYGSVIDHEGCSDTCEITASGYRSHVVLDLVDTKFTSPGAFNMWVQENPDLREVKLNSGGTAKWVVLQEAVLAKDLMDLAHSGMGLEASAIAQNAIRLIANYRPYTELQGTLPTLPGAPSASVSSPEKTPAPSVSPNQGSTFGLPAKATSRPPTVPTIPPTTVPPPTPVTTVPLPPPPPPRRDCSINEIMAGKPGCK
jgi:hypothetical protein